MDGRLPAGASFAFDQAAAALDRDLGRMEALDTKSGVLLAADGIVAGLLFATTGSSSPGLILTTAFATLMVSFVLALSGFVLNRYQRPPTPRRVAELASAGDDRLTWHFLPNMLRAYEVNQATLRLKGRLVAGAAASLLATFAILGGYSLYGTLL